MRNPPPRDHGNFVEAEKYGREALAGNAEVLGPHHKRTLRSMDSLGKLLQHDGKLDEAELLMRESYEVRRESDPSLKDPETLRAMSSLGHLLDQEHKFEEGEQLVRDALEKVAGIGFLQ